jgi:hypothetical protein
MMIIDPPRCDSADELRAWIAELESWLDTDDAPSPELLFDAGRALSADASALSPAPTDRAEVLAAIAQAREDLAGLDRGAAA